MKRLIFALSFKNQLSLQIEVCSRLSKSTISRRRFQDLENYCTTAGLDKVWLADQIRPAEVFCPARETKTSKLFIM